MKTITAVFTVALVIGWLASPAPAKDSDDTGAGEPAVTADVGYAGALKAVGACIGAAVVVIGGGLSISRICSRAVESIARQPEAAAQMFLAWLLPAAMIEGAMLFGLMICFVVARG